MRGDRGSVVEEGRLGNLWAQPQPIHTHFRVS